jgi:hypothetical protein
LDGRSPIEVLLRILKETNWSYDVKVKDDGALENLFFAHPGSIHLARINHHVALLDSTYKTNQYQLPLLHIIGQSALNLLFSIAFCFLARKDSDSYMRAINNLKKHVWRPQRIPKVFVTNRDSALRGALAEVFPDSQANLCTWHINKNITTNVKKYFPSSLSDRPGSSDPWKEFMSLWGKVTNAKTADIYFNQHNLLKKHVASLPAVIEYIETSIVPVKELFVVAWACKHPHLRNLNTSCVKSGHAYVKTFIKNSTGDLLSVFKSLSLAVDNQINQVHESIGRGTVKTLVNVPRCFIPLLGNILTFAIKECLHQFGQLKKIDRSEACSQTVMTGIGIPCVHKIEEKLNRNEVLDPNDFHLQWHLKYNPEITVSDSNNLICKCSLM